MMLQFQPSRISPTGPPSEDSVLKLMRFFFSPGRWAMDVRCWTFIFFFLLPVLSRAQAEMKLYETKYYNIYTDIDPEEEKEAAIRMTRMAEEYHARTQGFAGQITEKLPFYLYKSPSDYYHAGGLQGSAGVFIASGDTGKLMAIAGRKLTLDTWHTVQHEGFHQFAHSVIGGKMPVWLDEGLAEYFGESIFTGDGFVTGVIPPWRLSRLKREMADKQLKSFGQIMHLSNQEWSDQLTLKNYDQAWSMVYFLVHGEDQKYQSGLASCIREISQNRNPDVAFAQSIGDLPGVEEEWRVWWTQLPDRPTTALYGRAAVATMTSFVARAYAQKQTFADFEAFHAAVDDKTLKINPDDWLPLSLITTAFRLYGNGPKWELQTAAGRQPIVAMTLSDGTHFTGTFVLHGTRVDSVKVEMDDLAPALTKAQALLDQGAKQTARSTILAAIRANPKSPSMTDARKLLRDCR